MKRVLAGFATLAVLLTGTVAASGPAHSAPIPQAAVVAKPGMPEDERKMLEAYEREMRANGTEARVLAQAKKVDDDQKAGKKGWEGTKGQLRPQPPVAGKKAPCANPCFNYAAFYQDFNSDPVTVAQVDIMTGKPFVDTASLACEHSLGELSVHSGPTDHGDVVEVGWTVDKCQRADGNPILFGFHWVDGVPKGYGVGFVDYASNPINLGAGVPKPVVKEFEINQTSTAFWVYYDAQPVAYVPKSRWTPLGVVRPFNAAVADMYRVQAFYEIAGGDDRPKTDMGTGTAWNATGSPTPPVGTINRFMVGGTATAANLTATFANPSPAVWGVALDSPTGGRAGGPGWDSTRTTVGVAGS